MKIAFLTLGCKVNSYETEKMKIQFEHAGHGIVSFSEKADVYVVNTCTVTNIADRKSRKMLHRARRLNPEGIVVAAGCYVDSARQKGEVDSSVDVFLENKEKDHIVACIEKIAKEKGIPLTKEEGVQREKGGHTNISEEATKEERTRAYIKVQNGCNQFCTYCIIPYVRGELVSRPDEEIFQEVEKMAAQGYQEVVVTGIHLSSFGVDRGEGKLNANSFLELEGKPLLDLLQGISQIEGIERIRMGSLEPRIITDSFAKKLSEIPGICPHFHLSLQSGCDTVLKRMNRHYTAGEYLDGVRILKKYFEHPAITTDIIVGFPQETEEEFLATCDFAKEVAFAQIHIFKYSRRQGTIADQMEGQVSEQIKSQRSDALMAIESQLEKQYQTYFMGREEEVLLEEVQEIQGKSYLVGYNERYVRIAIALEPGEEPLSRCNTIATVRIVGQIEDSILEGKWK